MEQRSGKPIACAQGRQVLKQACQEMPLRFPAETKQRRRINTQGGSVQHCEHGQQALLGLPP